MCVGGGLYGGWWWGLEGAPRGGPCMVRGTVSGQLRRLRQRTLRRAYNSEGRVVATTALLVTQVQQSQKLILRLTVFQLRL